MKTIILTQEYSNRIAKEVEGANIGMKLLLELLTNTPDKSEIGRCVRIYITSKPLGGTLAVNHGEGWIPIYPECPNYPLKGRWYSPRSASYIPREFWRNAVMDALVPERILEELDPLGRKVVPARAAKLRHPFRAAVAVAILKNLGSQTVPV